MVSKQYSPEFRADAVALYWSDPAHTLGSVARELGVSRQLLHQWVNGAAGVDLADIDSRVTSTASTDRKTVDDSTTDPGPDQLHAQLAALRRELAQARRENQKLATERDILRAAAQFFAQEMIW